MQPLSGEDVIARIYLPDDVPGIWTDLKENSEDLHGVELEVDKWFGVWRMFYSSLAIPFATRQLYKLSTTTIDY